MSVNVFFSFHYKADSHRVARIKQIGAVTGQPVLRSNDWENVKRGGDDAIKRYIADGMKGKRCLVVLVGAKTSGRRWVKYEIDKAWTDRLGVVAVHIHNMEDLNGTKTTKGTDPFLGRAATDKMYDPPYTTSANVFAHIAENLPAWVDQAIGARRQA
jgi:hypothetical protein